MKYLETAILIFLFYFSFSLHRQIQFSLRRKIMEKNSNFNWTNLLPLFSLLMKYYAKKKRFETISKSRRERARKGKAKLYETVRRCLFYAPLLCRHIIFFTHLSFFLRAQKKVQWAESPLNTKWYRTANTFWVRRCVSFHCTSFYWKCRRLLNFDSDWMRCNEKKVRGTRVSFNEWKLMIQSFQTGKCLPYVLHYDFLYRALQ